MADDAPCPFCALPDDALIWCSRLAVAFLDRFPVSPGHALVIPRAHHRTYFDAPDEVQAALWQGVTAVKRHLEATLDPAPDGFNVGFNVDKAAGQTVWHAHVHVIPRYVGDVPDPTGGVRWVVPSRANYRGGS